MKTRIYIETSVVRYINRFDKTDPLMKNYNIQQTVAPNPPPSGPVDLDVILEKI